MQVPRQLLGDKGLHREEGEFTTSVKVNYQSELSVEEMQEKILNDDKTGILDRQILPRGYRFAWVGIVQDMEEQNRDMILFAVSCF